MGVPPRSHVFVRYVPVNLHARPTFVRFASRRLLERVRPRRQTGPVRRFDARGIDKLLAIIHVRVPEPECMVQFLVPFQFFPVIANPRDKLTFRGRVAKRHARHGNLCTLGVAVKVDTRVNIRGHDVTVQEFDTRRLFNVLEKPVNVEGTPLWRNFQVYRKRAGLKKWKDAFKVLRRNCETD